MAAPYTNLKEKAYQVADDLLEPAMALKVVVTTLTIVLIVVLLAVVLHNRRQRHNTKVGAQRKPSTAPKQRSKRS